MPGKRNRETYLDETVGGVPVIEIRHSKLFTILQLSYLHGKKGNCSFLVSFIGRIELTRNGVDVYWSNRGRQKVEEVTKRNAKGKTVPELRYGIGRLPGRTRGRCESEVGGKVLNTQEAST